MLKSVGAIIGLAILFISVSSLSLKVNHQQSFPFNGLVNLKADNGNYLTKITNKYYPMTWGAKITSVEAREINDPLIWWRVGKVGNQITLNNGDQLLGKCRYCYGQESKNMITGVIANQYPDSAGAITNTVSLDTLWNPELQTNGKWAFKNAANGNYLARCQGTGCVKGGSESDSWGFIHQSNPRNQWAQWTVSSI